MSTKPAFERQPPSCSPLSIATQFVALLAKTTPIPQEHMNMKNLFALIGFAVVLKKGLEWYHEYSELKREKVQRQSME